MKISKLSFNEKAAFNDVSNPGFQKTPGAFNLQGDQDGGDLEQISMSEESDDLSGGDNEGDEFEDFEDMS